MNIEKLNNLINNAFESPKQVNTNMLKESLEFIITQLETGALRVCELKQDKWVTNVWIKKAILLYFKYRQSKTISHHPNSYYDKIPLRFQQYTNSDFKQNNIRIVPPAHVRRGTYIGPSSILMPSYINIGAYIGSDTMVDTWATVGSCAQIGNNVHLSGGVGIGGVLEPIQANPVIIENNCFIGARSEVTEGVIVKKGAVLSMGIYLSQSTKIYNRETKQITTGIIPEYAVVVPGALPAEDNSHSLYAAIIVKQVDKQTRKKVSINKLLRDANESL